MRTFTGDGRHHFVDRGLWAITVTPFPKYWAAPVRQKAINARSRLASVAYDRTLMQRGCRAVRSITPALPEVELLSVRGFPLGRADKAKSE